MSRPEPQFQRDFTDMDIPLGEIFTDHGTDPITGSRLQRRFHEASAARIAKDFDWNRWERDLPWVSDRVFRSECKCADCERPRAGQVTAGRYHCIRGQHVTVALRRVLAAMYPGEDLSSVTVKARVFRNLDNKGEARLMLQSERDNREWTARDLRAGEVAAGEPMMEGISDALAGVGWAVSGPRRLAGVQSLVNQANVQGGDRGLEVARRIVTVASKAWDGDPKPVAVVINALGKLFNDQVNGTRAEDDRVAALLRDRKAVIQGYSSAKHIYRYICEQYNSGWTGSVKREDKRLRLPPY